MSYKKKEYPEKHILLRAIDLTSDDVICEGYNYDMIVEKAEKSKKDYILDFITDPEFNFVF